MSRRPSEEDKQQHSCPSSRYLVLKPGGSSSSRCDDAEDRLDGGPPSGVLLEASCDDDDIEEIEKVLSETQQDLPKETQQLAPSKRRR